MQSTSCEMLSWMNHRLKSMLPGVITTSDNADDTTLMAESKEELKSPWIKVKGENEKAGLKNSTFRKLRSGPITSWQIGGGKVETVTDFIFLGLQIHCKW